MSRYAAARHTVVAGTAALVLAGCGVLSPRPANPEYTMDTIAMEPTLPLGRRFTAKAVKPGEYAPKRGDIVVFHAPESWGRSKDTVSIARVIAIGAETIACCDAQGRVTVNGTALDEPYLGENSPLDVAPQPDVCRSRRFGPVTVEPDRLFVMGDTRLISQDSRCEGTVPAADVVGVVESP